MIFSQGSYDLHPAGNVMLRVTQQTHDIVSTSIRRRIDVLQTLKRRRVSTGMVSPIYPFHEYWKVLYGFIFLLFVFYCSSRGVLRKTCSENIKQIYMRTHMLKCGYKATLLKSHFGMPWVFFCDFTAYFQNAFS